MLNGFVNQQIWSSKNSKVVVKTPLLPQKVEKQLLRKKFEDIN